MKGLELPISMIVIIAIAVLVLVVVAAFFSGYFGTGVGSIGLEDAFSRGCAALRAGYECKPANVNLVQITDYKFSASDTAPYHTLAEICTKKNLGTDATICAKACGCVV
jgi:hypothetical protein